MNLQKLFDLDLRFTRELGVADRPGPLRSIAALLAHSGDSWFWMMGLGLVWLFGPEEWKRRALLMGVGILITAVLVLAIKFSIRRRRPEGEWGSLYRRTDPHSFPSGHATRAVLLAIMAIGLGPGWFGLLVALWAPLVVVARVAMGVHYLSDVVAGALLGLFLGIVELQVLTSLGL